MILKKSFSNDITLSLFKVFIPILLILYKRNLLLFGVQAKEYINFEKWLASSSILLIIVGFGLPMSLNYYGTSKNLYKSILSRSTKRIFLFSILAATIQTFLSHSFIIGIFTGFYLFSLTGITVIENFFIKFSERKNFILINICRTILLVTLLVYSLTNVLNYLWIYTIPVCLTLLIFYLRMNWVTSQNIKLPPLSNELRFGFKSVVFNILTQIFYFIPVFFLDQIYEIDEFNYFLFTLSLSRLSFLFVDGLGNYLTPLYRQRRNTKIILIKAILISIGINVIFSAMVFAIGDYFIVKYLELKEFNRLLFLILSLGNCGLIVFKLTSRFLAMQDDWANLISIVALCSLILYSYFPLSLMYSFEYYYMLSCILLGLSLLGRLIWFNHD